MGASPPLQTPSACCPESEQTTEKCDARKSSLPGTNRRPSFSHSHFTCLFSISMTPQHRKLRKNPRKSCVQTPNKHVLFSNYVQGRFRGIFGDLSLKTERKAAHLDKHCRLRAPEGRRPLCSGLIQRHFTFSGRQRLGLIQGECHLNETN